MKVTLDRTKLRDQGRITQAEFDKLSQLAALETGSLAFNILVGFGVVAVSGGVLALAPTPVTAIGLGVVISALGLRLVRLRSEQWWLLVQISLLVGAILFGGGVVYTQCFARLGANPLAFVMAGLLTLAFAFGMRTLNRDLQDAA